MTLSAHDLSKLHGIMPGTEAVTYYSRTSGNTFTSRNLPAAERRDISNQDQIALGIALGVETEVWFVWTDQLGGIVPKQGDKLKDKDGDFWHVKAVSKELLRQRNRLTCTKAAE